VRKNTKEHTRGGETAGLMRKRPSNKRLNSSVKRCGFSGQKKALGKKVVDNAPKKKKVQQQQRGKGGRNLGKNPNGFNKPFQDPKKKQTCEAFFFG